ncbi:metal-dependent hydrolase [Acidovorax sp. NPDC077693]|uniref:metal-dependent hydrolase n=1 Tax=unclassified Acidovorax TaxID=2684926 RepID=UPI0037C76004
MRVDLGADHRFWNGTSFRSYLFNAFSLLLPSGEQFVIQSMQDAAARISCSDSLSSSVAQFVREERAHQSAHYLYNRRLAAQGYDAEALEARIILAIRGLEKNLGWRDRLALAAALEYLTAMISHYSLRGQGWLVDDNSQQANIWRWHCAEELEHYRVALQFLIKVRGLGYSRRMVIYVLASLILFGDVARHIWSFFRTDRYHGRLKWSDGVASFLNFVISQGFCLVRMLFAWLAYALPLRSLAKMHTYGSPRDRGIEVRLLEMGDIPQLLVLEQCKWSEGAAADADAIERRIQEHPELCIGAFAGQSGKILASLFMKPISEAQVLKAQTWADCANAVDISKKKPFRDLFGISLSSADAKAVEKLFEFFWPRALKGGWRHIYLGSPAPGLASWRRQRPHESVENYFFACRAGVPCDPQLRYYWKKGFRTVVACRPGYFPHAESLDYGVVMRGRIPLSELTIFWRLLPLRWLQWIMPYLSRWL